MLSVLLVDDEMSTLDGISFAFMKYADRYRIDGMFQSAQKALDYLEKPGTAESVDVVITDVRMPGIDGVEFTRILCKQYPHLYTIALSGYSDYDLVRQCMKNGAVDYLLKPNSFSTLQLLLDSAAAQKAQREMAQRVSKLEQSIHKGPEHSEALDALMQSKASLFAAVLAGLNATEGNAGETVRAFLQTERETLGMVLRHDDLLYLIANGFDDEREFCEAMGALHEKLVGAYPDLTILSAFDASLPPKDRYARMRQCHQAVVFALFNGVRGILSSTQWHELMEKPWVRIDEQGLQTDLLAALLLKGEQEAFIRQLDKIKGQLLEPSSLFDPAVAKKQILRLLLALDQLLAQASGKARPHLQDDYVRHVEIVRTREGLAQWLSDFAQSLTVNVPVQKQVPRYIHEAVAFIRKNYMNDIRLNDVAESTFLNEWYLSTQFKKYCGMTFKEYLNHVRIEAAKELLQQPDLKLWQISEMVGIRDATYFTNVFKKHASMSPREYQRLFFSVGAAHGGGDG